MTEQVKVTQASKAARDAAGDLFDSLAGCTIPLNFGTRARNGEFSELTQIFARFEAQAMLEGAKAMQEAAAKQGDEAITHHITEIGLQTYFRKPSEMLQTDQWQKLHKAEQLVRDMRNMPSKAIRNLDPQAIIAEHMKEGR